nr:MAG TPA: hypothetical protein [Crassvirales sp.]
MTITTCGINSLTEFPSSPHYTQLIELVKQLLLSPVQQSKTVGTLSMQRYD